MKFHLAVYDDTVTVHGKTRQIHRNGRLLLTIEDGDVRFMGMDGTPVEIISPFSAYQERYNLDQYIAPLFTGLKNALHLFAALSCKY